MDPDNESYTEQISALQKSQQIGIFDLISRAFGIAGVGNVSITGEHHWCRVEIKSTKKDDGDPLLFDLRIQTSFPLVNGLYRFRFLREGFEPLEKIVPVVAEQVFEILIGKDEWVPIEE